VGCSQWVADEARKSVLKDCNIRHFYNGFDLDVFKPSPSDFAQRLGIEGKHVLLGPAGKWLSGVNKETLEYFIKVMPEDYVLLLFGYLGEDMAMADNVKIYGYTTSKEEMAQLYTMADAFVNCSREDTLSSLNLESQACGTPVVTYEATGSKETVDGQCGFAVKTGDAEALWLKTKEVVEKGKDFFSESCLSFISRQFNKAENYNKYIQLYQEILEV
jgi:glycosyltransferase involved in cell wall biosynthesis